jgi:hypothetical protein
MQILRVGQRIGEQGVAVRRRARRKARADGAGAPVLFSTTMYCPILSWSIAANTRAGTSVKPPGANGTIMLMVRFG